MILIFEPKSTADFIEDEDRGNLSLVIGKNQINLKKTASSIISKKYIIKNYCWWRNIILKLDEQDLN